MREIKSVLNQVKRTDDKYFSLMSQYEMDEVINFHRSFPQYERTPLVKLNNLAKYFGVQSIYVKDESYRFGLNAFKGLGGSFAIGKYIAEQLRKEMKELPYPVLISEKIKEEIGELTFITATDGNHGRGVAWAAKELGQKCIVRMPKGSTEIRKNHIAGLGAEVTIEKLNYDDCVRLASEQAKEINNGVLIQDTAWEGYERIPSWIMQGYGTLSMEAEQQMKEDGCDWPTHIFIQAGVGSLAGAVVGYFAGRCPENPPVMAVVEASAADCLYCSAKEGTGELEVVDGDLETIMAGLACGEANTVSWDILRNHADVFLSVPDFVSAWGMRIYGNPLVSDSRIISGESGAVTMGALAAILSLEKYADLKKTLKLDKNSRVLLISTEGDTDPERYRNIVWNGQYSADI